MADNQVQNKGLHITGAIIVLVAGIFLLYNPFSNTFVIALFVAFHLLVRSLQGLIFAFSMKDAKVENWYLPAIISMIGIVLSLALADQPMVVGLSLVILTGMSFIFAEIIGIAFSIVLKRLKELANTSSEHIRYNSGSTKETDYEILDDY